RGAGTEGAERLLKDRQRRALTGRPGAGRGAGPRGGPEAGGRFGLEFGSSFRGLGSGNGWLGGRGFPRGPGGPVLWFLDGFSGFPASVSLRVILISRTA